MNKIMMAVQKLGIPTGPAMVLTVPGRRSGQPRSTPMTPFTHDGKLYTVAGYSGADWPVLREFPVQLPVGVGFAKRSGMVVDGTPDEFEALAGQLAVFRFDPVS
jgi:hypothetical protein